MSIFGNLFAKKHAENGMFTPPPPEHTKSDARDEFYANLKAQHEGKAEDLIMGSSEEMSDEERQKIAKALVPVDVMKSLKVVERGDDNEVDAQDSIPEGRVNGTENDGRFSDIWSTFARINPRILRHFISRTFVGYPACEIFGTHEIISPCCSMPGKDAVSPGYKVVCISSQHKQDDEHIIKETDWLRDIKHDSDRMGLNDVCRKLAYYTRLYGIGVAIPRVELLDEHTMEEPYNPALIKPKSYKGFSVVDPQKFTWDLTDETLYDPLSEYYMRPEFLRLFTRKDVRIHRSWCVICIYCEVGDDLKGTYMWGGVPLSQLLYERVFCADKLANEIVALAMSKRTVVKDGNMKAMIANPKLANHTIERWNGYRNNQSIAFKEPGETITQLETTLADLQPLSAQQYQYAAAIAGIPVTKLLKNVPSGLQATGQYEQDEYEQTLEDIREQQVRPLLDKHYELYIHSAYPDRVDLKVEIEFNPIQSPKASEKQQIDSQRGSMVTQLLQNNAITITEARAILRSGDSAAFATLSDKTPEILSKLEAMKDPEKQQEMQMKMQQQQMMAQQQAGAEQGDQPAQDPQQAQEFDENKGMFQAVLNDVLSGTPTQGAEGGEGGEAAQPQPQPQPQNSEGAPAPQPAAPAV